MIVVSYILISKLQQLPNKYELIISLTCAIMGMYVNAN